MLTHRVGGLKKSGVLFYSEYLWDYKYACSAF